jgi:hypothetical protein
VADIRCPNCGKNNPDFLDLCQFCQSPLKPESMLHIGEKPTKKNTGELESVLPDWLRDVRQQARESAEETAAQEAAQPKIQKNEAPDLLAGLASQARADDDEIPDWLAGISPAATAKPSETPSREPETDPMAETKGLLKAQEEKDELSEWLSRAAEQPSEPFTVEPGESQDDSDWMSNLDASATSLQQPAPPKEEEDLSWLRNLEASAKQSAELSEPRQDLGWTPGADSSQPVSQEEDLSWLNNLGGITEPSQPFDQTQGKPAPTQPAAPKDDLSWLDNLGGSLEPPQPTQPSAAQDDLSWLNNLGRTSELSQPEPAKPSPHEDLSWLNNLDQTAESSPSDSAQPAAQEDLDWLNKPSGSTSEPSRQESTQPSSQEDLSWLNDMRTSDVTDFSSSALSPRQTAPLSEEAQNESIPEWLKSATEEPSMPPLGAGALDWFASHNLEEDQIPATPESSAGINSGLSEETSTLPIDQTQDEPVLPESDIFSASSESLPGTNPDVESLFSMNNVPDWLSNPELGASDVSVQRPEIPPVEEGESLAPVELPSWVQAMRPVEAVISETASGIEDQTPERDGPLAGLRGVIPLLPIGSSRRPKALSLTLQATDEQQASAGLLEQILAGETSPRPSTTSAFLTSQRVLRWALTGLVIIVLGAMIALRSQSMPVSTTLPAEAAFASSAIATIPENAPVLVVLDYEPALAGEMEAVSGPFLGNMVLLRHPNLSFLSTSPNGSALVERLMANTKINRAAPEGLGYQAGEGYFNLGYLPGGSAGVLAFVESPQTAIRSADDVENFSQYAAVIVLTDHAESGRVWVEQLDARKQSDSALTSQPLLVVASAQAGPLLQPYVSSRQVAGMISGLPDAARYEFVKNMPPGMARTYWDTFGIGLLLAVILIAVGSLWSLFTGIRLRRVGIE